MRRSIYLGQISSMNNRELPIFDTRFVLRMYVRNCTFYLSFVNNIKKLSFFLMDFSWKTMSTIRWSGLAPSASSTVVSVSYEVSSLLDRLLCVGIAGGAEGGDGVGTVIALQCS